MSQASAAQERLAAGASSVSDGAESALEHGLRARWLGWGQRFRILTLVDHFSRESPSLAVGLSMTGRRVVKVLSRLALE